jgi:hypothetical protein
MIKAPAAITIMPTTTPLPRPGCPGATAPGPGRHPLTPTTASSASGAFNGSATVGQNASIPAKVTVTNNQPSSTNRVLRKTRYPNSTAITRTSKAVIDASCAHPATGPS